MTLIPERSGYPIGWGGKLLLGLGSLVLIAGFALSAWLDPDPSGSGTHRQLGLPPCTFRLLLSIPCPSCGMTTSFANLAHGRLFDAARANVAGPPLAFVCLALIPWSWISIRKSALCWVERPDQTALWVAGGLGGLAVLQWVVRLIW